MADLWIILAVLVAGIAALYLLLRARLDRRLARVDPAAEVRDELASVMVEMNRTTDRNVALLEDRIAQLTQLLGEADRRIALLRRESEKNDASRVVYAQLARPAAALEAERAAAEAAGPPPAERPAAERPAAERRAPGPTRPAAEEPLEARVLRLEREGFSAGVIASRVGSTVGEVELIISLARRRP